MRALVGVFLLIACVAAAPAPLTALQKQIVELWGANIDYVYAEKVLAEEAKRLGLTTEQHYEDCSAAGVDIFMFSVQENEDIRTESKEAVKFGPVVFNSTDEVMPEIKKRAPKTHAALTTRFVLIEKYLDRVDTSAQKFVKNVGQHFLDAIVVLSKAPYSLDSPIDLIGKLGKAISKSKAEYVALPQESKDNLDRVFCQTTASRIGDKDGKFKKMVDMAEIAAQLT